MIPYHCLCIVLAFLVTISTSSSYEYHPLTQVLRERFYSHFEERCNLLSFVDDYFRLLYESKTLSFAKFASFVFVDDYRHRHMHLGGLGDRLAGLLSTFFWSLRYRRILLLEDWQGEFSKFFTPLPLKLRVLLKVRSDGNISSGSQFLSLWTEYSQLLEHNHKINVSSVKKTFFQKEKQSLVSSSFHLAKSNETEATWNHWQSVLYNVSDSSSEFNNNNRAGCSLLAPNDYECLWQNFNTKRSLLSTYFCHNVDMTRFRFRHCALNKDYQHQDTASNFKTMSDKNISTHVNWVRIRHNRALLCRWKKDFSSRSNLEEIPNRSQDENQHLIHSLKGDLGLWAGCALRTLLWPTEQLWQQFDRFLRKHLAEYFSSEEAIDKESKVSFFHNVEVMGLHFRCGDHNYPGARNVSSPATKYQSCLSKSSSHSNPMSPPTQDAPRMNNSPFHGTAPLDELSLSSPDSLSFCAVHHLYPNSSTSTRLYLLGSDSADVVAAWQEGLSVHHRKESSNYMILPLPTGCHVDYLYHPENDAKQCMRDTLLSWFVLSLADTLVVQPVHEPERHGRGDQHPMHSVFPKMISSFSRSAAWFSLGGRFYSPSTALSGIVEHMTLFASSRPGDKTKCQCDIVSVPKDEDKFGYSDLSQGNWQCE